MVRKTLSYGIGTVTVTLFVVFLSLFNHGLLTV